MTLNPTQQFSAEQTYDLIKQVADKESDRFIIKISRRRGNMSGLLEQVATFADATSQHAANPETWIPSFLGGGEFGIGVFHPSSPMSRIGGLILFTARGDAYPVPKFDVLKDPQWSGPGTLVYPNVKDIPLQQLLAAQQSPGAPQFNQPGVTVVQGQPLIPGVARTQDQIDQKNDALHQRELALAADRAELELEAQHAKDEVRRAEENLKLKQEFKSEMDAIKSTLATKQSDQSTTIDLVTALAPVIERFLSSSQEMKMRQMEMQAKQAETLAAIQRESQMQVFTALQSMNQKSPVSPEITMAFEIMKSQSQVQSDMMKSQVEAFGTVSKSSIGMIEAIADLRLGGEPENPILLAVREGVKALATLSGGAQASGRRAAQPTKTPNSQAPALPANGAGKAPQQPVPVQKFEPKPNMPPVNEVLTQATPTAFDGVPPTQPNALDTLETLIRDHHEPVEETAQYFMASLGAPEMKAALTKYGGDLNKLVSDRLGMWALEDESNRDYLSVLVEKIEELAEAAGLLDDEEEAEVPAPPATQTVDAKP